LTNHLYNYQASSFITQVQPGGSTRYVEARESD
jgi:hypothetical protein